MEANGQTTCIIPFYNEGKRIFSVLDIVITIPEIAQIICIDDGSSDHTSDEIERLYPQIDLIRLPKNGGKTAAVKYALNEARNEFVLLMDADLQFILSSEISFAIQAMSRQSADMIILRRIKAPWFVKMDRGDVLFSGERILRTRDLQTILTHKVENYQLEIAINNYMIAQEKEVFWAPSSAFNTFKMQKMGRLEGFVKELNMFIDIVYYAGVQNYLRQVTTFARRPCKNCQPAGIRTIRPSSQIELIG